MTRFVIDSFAWIEYLNGSARGKKVMNIVEDKKNELFTSAVTIAEIISKFLRSDTNPNTAIVAIQTLSKIKEVDSNLSIIAGKLHAEMRKQVKDFGLSDAFIMALARITNSKILTGDKHFEHVKEAIII